MATLGRYEILEKLGSGSMGTVYRARDTVLDREIALKTIRTGADVEPELRERFYREARACARLHHPAIVIVHDLGEVDKTAYIAMELLEGSDFRKLIAERCEIPVGVKIEVMAQVCEALAHAHQNGIIHRDVKPSNLFLVDNHRAKVLDFGIARLPSSQLTVAGRILGTPNYMSPEQVLGKQTDARSDLFSAAVVFFEWLVYKHPFQSGSIPRRIVESDPDTLFEVDSNLPVPLNNVLLRALAKEPAQRYATGEEMATELRGVLNSLSPSFTRYPLEQSKFRELRADPPAAVRSEAAPSTEELEELNHAEVLRLIPDFEGALERGDASSARRLFTQLEAIGAVDSRFSETVTVCKERLAALDVRSAAERGAALASADSDTINAPAPSDATEEISSPKTCPACGQDNRSTATFCIKCGARLPLLAGAEATARPVAVSTPAAPAVDMTRLYNQPVRATAPHVAYQPPPPPPAQGPPHTSYVPRPDPVSHPNVKPDNLVQAAIRQYQANPERFWWIGGACLLLLLIVVGAVWLIRPIPLERPVATATVRPAKAIIYKERTIGSPTLALLQGQRVNILHTPRSGQEWVGVQFPGPPKTSAPGYMKVADLENWDSTDPEVGLDLVKIFAAGDEDELNRLQDFIRRFEGTHAARAAHLEAAMLELEMIRKAKAASQPSSVWRRLMDSARLHLSVAGRDQELAASADNAMRSLDQISADTGPAPAFPTAQSTQPSQTPSQTAITPQERAAYIRKQLDDAEALRKQHKYSEAENKVLRVLRIQPNNADALAEQESIKTSREFFGNQ